jgi:hypothetical protein
MALPALTQYRTIGNPFLETHMLAPCLVLYMILLMQDLYPIESEALHVEVVQPC